jgi:elongation factor P
MLSITDLKKGALIVIEGSPYKVIEYSQKQMGRGGSIVVTKIKNLITGSVLEKTFKGVDSVEQADINNISVSYLYSDSEKAYFMQPETFEQFKLPIADIKDLHPFLNPDLKTILQIFNSKPISLEIPKNVAVQVLESESVVRGDTSSALTKIVKLVNGLEVRVPAFVKKDEIILIDTESLEYKGRA